MNYSFCEPVVAAPLAKWCIRKLTDVGHKFGGGVDTPSLCGRVEPPYGWDVDVAMDMDHPAICLQCKAIALDTPTPNPVR